ncbi:hypothetical protein GQ53DRAFT_748459 [Thozetella sp. PMI_491]|nr:hypothetical protein GQ53DRAFT_748459 [Thozetella sp. PMI_491]
MAPTPPEAKQGLSAMVEQTPTKTMSARLMTMKFMQRAAASESSSPATPPVDKHSDKRRKVSYSPATASPSTPLFDMKAAKAAMQEEEKKREEAVAKLAQQLGDSHWVLEGPMPGSRRAPSAPLNVVQVGFAQIDSADISDNETRAATTQGKKSFGVKAVKKEPVAKRVKKRKASDSEEGETSSSDSGSDGESPDRPGDGQEQSESGRRAASWHGSAVQSQSSFSRKRSEERKKSQQFAGKRRKKELNLNKPISISAAGTGARFSR